MTTRRDRQRRDLNSRWIGYPTGVGERTNGDIHSQFLDALRNIHPGVDEADISASRVFWAPYVEPLYPLG